MRIFKFGGASVKSSDGVKNLVAIVAKNLNQPLVVVVSAMGKITNKLEQLSADAFQYKRIDQSILNEVKRFHLEIIADLFKKDHPIFKRIENEFTNLEQSCLKHLEKSYDFYYDQTVSLG